MSGSLTVLRPLDLIPKDGSKPCRRDFPHLDPYAWWIVEMIDGTPHAHGPYAIPEEVDAAVFTLERAPC